MTDYGLSQSPDALENSLPGRTIQNANDGFVSAPDTVTAIPTDLGILPGEVYEVSVKVVTKFRPNDVVYVRIIDTNGNPIDQTVLETDQNVTALTTLLPAYIVDASVTDPPASGTVVPEIELEFQGTNSGDYEVYTSALRIRDAIDTGDSIQPVDTVETSPNTAPSASFTKTDSDGDDDYASGEVNTDASGSSDPDGFIQSYDWDWGDGTTGTGETATHTYSSGGTYTITLTVTDNQFATTTASQTVTIPALNEAPTASQEGSTRSGTTFNGDATNSTDPDGTIVEYQWNLGDGTTKYGETITHSYSFDVQYTVDLIVTDDDGATDSVSVTYG